MTEKTELSDELIRLIESTLSDLIEECETNYDFAVNPHGTEYDALENARGALDSLRLTMFWKKNDKVYREPFPKCPKCPAEYGDDIQSRGDWEADSDYAWRRWKCQKCGFSWIEEYRFSVNLSEYSGDFLDNGEGGSELDKNGNPAN